VQLLALIAAVCLPTLAAPWVITRAGTLYPGGGSAYFVARHALTLYVMVPLAALSSFASFLLPGALFSLAAGAARRLEELLLFGFAASLILCIVLSTVTRLVFGVPMPGAVFFVSWYAVAAALAVALRWRIARAQIASPLAGPGRRRLIMIAACTWLAIALLAPKILWENFNVDGVEAFEFGRSLTWHVAPYWAVTDGVFGLYHNFVLFAYPNHWFITLLGPIEAAARLPFLLYLGLLFAALLLLIEQDRTRPLNLREEAALWLALGLFVVVQAFNTNYDPFFADLAEMAATDSLWVLCFVAAVYALWSRRYAWFVSFAIMNYLSSPGGLLLLLALGALTLVAPLQQRAVQLRWIAAAVAICVLLGIAYETWYAPEILGQTRVSQFSSVNMLRRLFPPTLTEFVRFNALLFTTGILPAFALAPALARRRADAFSFVVAGVTLLYFGTLYIQVWTSLHQFTPVMLLPLVVFWRQYLTLAPRWQSRLWTALVATTALCLLLSLPRHFLVNRAARALGLATDLRVGNAGPGYVQATQAAWALSVLVPEGYRLDYPHQPWGTDPYTWIYYAQLPKPERNVINYVVQAAASPAPDGFRALATRAAMTLYVKDIELWQRQRAAPFPRIVVSPLYEPILRNTYAFFRSFSADQEAKSRLQVR
jgi:hypothetical protein